MRNGICPKCGSSTVYAKFEGLKYYVNTGVVFVYTGRMTMASPAMAYVCSTCGYFENYITDQKKLAEVAEKWQKVAVEDR
jgi:ribosomal protein S27AE